MHQNASLVDQLGPKLIRYLPRILVQFNEEVVGELLGFAACRLHVHVVEENALEIILVIIVVVVFIVVLFLLLVLVGVIELIIAVVVAVLARTAAILVFFLILATESIGLKILLTIIAFPASLVCRRSLRYLTLQTPLPIGSASSLTQLCILS